MNCARGRLDGRHVCQVSVEWLGVTLHPYPFSTTAKRWDPDLDPDHDPLVRVNPSRFFLPEAMDRQRVPVALLSGFLGSGKTTLLNGVLRDPRMADTAVAINEFGAVPVDHQLIDHGVDKTIVLANGCVCCNLAGDVEDAVMRIFSRRGAGEVPRFVRLIVEPSGLADPAPLAQALMRNPAMSRVLRLDGITTTVDAVFGSMQLDKHPEAAKQAALATRLVLTKTDLAPPAATDRLRQQLGNLNPVAPVLDVRHGAIDPAELFSPHFLDPNGPAPPDLRLPLRTAAAGHDTVTLATVLTATAPLQWAALDQWLRGKRVGMGETLLRIKGIVNVAGSDRPVVLHGVHHVLHPPVALDRWPDEDHGTRLVLITQGVDQADVRQGWDAVLTAPRR